VGLRLDSEGAGSVVVAVDGAAVASLDSIGLALSESLLVPAVISMVGAVAGAGGSAIVIGTAGVLALPSPSTSSASPPSSPSSSSSSSPSPSPSSSSSPSMALASSSPSYIVSSSFLYIIQQYLKVIREL
jgi:hypothetical protein